MLFFGHNAGSSRSLNFSISSIFLAFYTNQLTLIFHILFFKSFIWIKFLTSVHQKDIPRPDLVDFKQVVVDELLDNFIRFNLEGILLSSSF